MRTIDYKMIIIIELIVFGKGFQILLYTMAYIYKLLKLKYRKELNY